MSYDLFLQAEALREPEILDAWFGPDGRYRVEGPEALYVHPDTDVHFSFTWR